MTMNANLKKILGITWKVGLGLIGLSALVIGILIFNVWYEETRGRDIYNDTTLSKDVVVEAYNNNLVRVKNKATGRYTTSKVRWVSCKPNHDILTVYCDKDNNRGYINCNTGKIAIPAEKAQFRCAWHFSEGYAFVVLKDEDSLSVIEKL